MSVSVEQFNEMFSEMAVISGRTYFPLTYVSGVFPDMTVGVSDLIRGDTIAKEMHLLPAVHGMLSYYYLAVCQDEEMCHEFYDCVNNYLDQWKLGPMPVAVTFENEEQDVLFYSIIPLPNNVRYQNKLAWLEYATTHVQCRMTHETNPSGIYNDVLQLSLAYSNLLAVIIVRNDLITAVSVEDAKTFEVPQTRELHD